MTEKLNVRPFRADTVPVPRGLTTFELPAGPLDIEIGCGAGMHPLRYAAHHPERTVVAIEHTRTRFSAFTQALRAAKPFPENLHAVHANAIGWITHALPEASVDRYFLLYPNPFPKARDLNKRWYAMPFMERVLWTLKPGGTLRLATNLPYYVDEAREYFTQHWGLSVVSATELRAGQTPVLAEDIPVPRTHFEKKYLERGETCFDLLVRKPLDNPKD